MAPSGLLTSENQVLLDLVKCHTLFKKQISSHYLLTSSSSVHHPLYIQKYPWLLFIFLLLFSVQMEWDMWELPVVLKTKQKFYFQIPFTKELFNNIDENHHQLISILNTMEFCVPSYCPWHRPFRDITSSWNFSSFLSEVVVASKHSSVQLFGCNNRPWSCNLSF